MKVKNLNPMERHVEKIVLGVAVAGAGYLAYAGLQPTKLDNPDIEVTAVESKIEQAVASVEASAKRLENTPLVRKAPVNVNIDPNTRLPKELIVQAPRFAPLQRSASAATQAGPQDTTIVLTPYPVPAPVNVEVTVGRGVIIPGQKGPDGQPIAVAPGALAPEPLDVNFARIAGYFPESEFRAMLTREGNPAQKTKPLPQDRQQLLAYYRVEVERRTRSVTGVGQWQPVAATKAVPPQQSFDLTGVPYEQAREVALLLQRPEVVHNTLQPTFYADVMLPPVPAAPARAVPAGGGGRPVAGGVGAPGVGGARPVAPAIPPAGEGFESSPVAAGGGAPGSLTPSANPAYSLFWFFDETVVPGEAYEYRTRVVMFNPTYGFDPRIGLDKDELRSKPFIASNWVAAGNVEIKGNLHFFFSSSSMSNNSASVRIYKFTLGRWQAADFSANPGSVVGTTARATRTGLTVDFSTGYTVVDVIPVGSGNFRVVLLSPSGELVSRTTGADQASSDRREIDDEFNKQFKTPKTPAAKAGNPGAEGF